MQAYGIAFAEAVACGGEESDALAEATAIAFCEQGGTATAFARAFSVALLRNRTASGCPVLTQQSTCDCRRPLQRWCLYRVRSVESQVLGLCGLLQRFGINLNGISGK